MKENNNRRLRFIDFLIVILCLSVMAYNINLFRLDLFQTINLYNVQPVGTIIIRENIVQRRVADRVLWDRPAAESPVYLGDLIRTAELSSATIDMEGQRIDLGENTLIRIQPVTDSGGALQIELVEGNLGVAAAEDGGGLQLNLMGRKVKVSGGTTLSAAVKKDNLTVQVNSGTAAFVEEGGNREVSSGTTVAFDIAFDSEGTEKIQPAVVVTQPRPNARYVKNDSQPFPVSFAWNRVNLQPEDPLRLEIAADRNFDHIVQTAENLNTSAEISLEAGLWNWRLSYKDTILSDGRLAVVEEANVVPSNPAPSIALPEPKAEMETEMKPETKPEPEAKPEPPPVPVELRLLSPAQRAKLPGLTALREQTVFRWDAVGEVRSSRFVLSRNSNPLRGRPAVEIANPGRTIRLNRLEEGIWYWTVEARNVNGLVSSAAPRQLEILPIPLLPAPGSRLPASGHRIGIDELKTQRSIAFKWSAVQGANAYIFTLYEQAENGRRQINRATVATPAWTLEDISVLNRGAFIWQVEAVSRNSGGAIEQRGNMGENTFIMDIPLPSPVHMEDPGVLYDD